MPTGDETGPAGLGPMTGRAAGFCAGYPVPGYMNPIGGRGYRCWGRGFWGRGGGRGWRNRFYATGLSGRARAGFSFWGPVAQPVTAQQECAILEDQAAFLEKQISATKSRIEELKATEKKEDK